MASSSEESCSSDDEESVQRRLNGNSFSKNAAFKKSKALFLSHERSHVSEMEGALKASSSRATAAAHEVGRLRVECEKLQRAAEAGKETSRELVEAKEETVRARRRAAEATFSSDRLREQLEASREREKSLSMRVSELRRVETSLADIERGFSYHRQKGSVAAAQAATSLLQLEKYLLLGATGSMSQGKSLYTVLGSEGCTLLAECSDAVRNLEALLNGNDSMSRKSPQVVGKEEPRGVMATHGELLREYQQVVLNLRSEIDNKSKQINELNGRLEDTVQKASLACEENSKIKERIIRTEERGKYLENTSSKANQELERLEQLLKDTNANLVATEQRMQLEKEAHLAATQEMLKLGNEIVPLKENLKQKIAALRSLEEEKAQLLAGKRQVEEAASDAVAMAMRASDTAKQLGTKLTRADKELIEMKHVNQELLEKLILSEEACEELESRSVKLKRERDHLRDLHRRLEDPNFSQHSQERIDDIKCTKYQPSSTCNDNSNLLDTYLFKRRRNQSLPAHPTPPSQPLLNNRSLSPEKLSKQSPDPLLKYLSPTSSPLIPLNKRTSVTPHSGPSEPVIEPSYRSKTWTSSERRGGSRAALTVSLEKDMEELDREILGLRQALQDAAQKSTQSILAEVALESA